MTTVEIVGKKAPLFVKPIVLHSTRVGRQMSLFPETEDHAKPNITSTFSANLSQPIHRWFRYSAGFSGQWAQEVIEGEKAKGRRRVLDPFAGCGTVLLEGEKAGIQAKGVEAHPFIYRVARVKLHWRENPSDFLQYAVEILKRADHRSWPTADYPALVQKCYPPDVLKRLHALKVCWSRTADGSPFAELTWLALASILRECSPVGTAQWQYVLPNKSKSRPSDPFQAFEAKIHLMAADMQRRQNLPSGPKAEISPDDARGCNSIPDGWADLVVTSPPYANNYDYADATRLELCFFGEINGWGDLQGAVRKHLVRSCTQHVAALQLAVENWIGDPLLAPIHSELTQVCRNLAVVRESHGGKKPYHLMVAAYFNDLAKVWRALRRVTAEGALVCFVIGDSAPYGVYVPVEKWLGELAVASGFSTYRFEKTRDRNIKWKNRKHRVPLHEGRLWVEG